MIPASTTDGSVAARWKPFDLIVRSCSVYIFSPLPPVYIKAPLDVSSDKYERVPFQNCRSVFERRDPGGGRAAEGKGGGGCRKVNRAPFCLSISDNWLKALCVALEGNFLFN